MDGFERIVVGVSLVPRTDELSPGSHAAAQQAAWLARLDGARVWLVHSAERERYYDPRILDYRVVSEGISPAGREAIEALGRDLTSSGILCEVIFDEEKAWMSIVREALRRQADLVVVARHDRTGPNSHELGSLPHELLRMCPVPVRVVDPGHDSRPAQIVAATDLTPAETRALELAMLLAQRAKAKLHVVHCYRKPEDARSADQEMLRHRAIELIRATLAGRDMHDDAHLHVACHSPVGGTLAVINRLQPDLLVMGSVSRGGVPGLLIGSTAEKILEGVTCSLLTVKPDDFRCPIGPDVLPTYGHEHPRLRPSAR